MHHQQPLHSCGSENRRALQTRAHPKAKDTDSIQWHGDKAQSGCIILTVHDGCSILGSGPWRAKKRGGGEAHIKICRGRIGRRGSVYKGRLDGNTYGARRDIDGRFANVHETSCTPSTRRRWAIKTERSCAARPVALPPPTSESAISKALQSTKLTPVADGAYLSEGVAVGRLSVVLLRLGLAACQSPCCG